MRDKPKNDYVRATYIDKPINGSLFLHEDCQRTRTALRELIVTVPPVESFWDTDGTVPPVKSYWDTEGAPYITGRDDSYSRTDDIRTDDGIYTLSDEDDEYRFFEEDTTNEQASSGYGPTRDSVDDPRQSGVRFLPDIAWQHRVFQLNLNYTTAVHPR